MARQNEFIVDKSWPEVNTINNYAIFMGYLLMGVRGLGLLVLTWTTAVLLGGFVTMLQKKDFWCLTAITLVQTAGVFNFLLKEKASDVGNSLKGLLAAVFGAVVRQFRNETNTSAKSSNIIEDDTEPSIARIVAAVVLMVIQVLVLGIVLCPLAVLYVLGLYLSAGISLWRLIQHDYGNPDGGANLKPALNVLYSLAVAQGVVYGYRALYDSAARTGLVEEVAEYYSLETNLVSDYLDETVAGCMKDPSFARGRNLVTYGVELLMSRYGYISGVLFLGRITRWDTLSSARLRKELLSRSASFNHVVQQLVETFGPTSPYITEIRVSAARIVASVAGDIRLEQFPQAMMIECISSLLDTFEEYSWRPEGYEQRVNRMVQAEVCERDWLIDEEERDWLLDEEELPLLVIPRAREENDKSRNPLQRHRDLLVQGLCILRKLAANEDNCRVISNTEGLLSKTMVHLTPDKLHEDHHHEWYLIAEESLEFMNRFMATLGGTEATKLTSEISSSSQAAIIRTLECHKCGITMKRKAAQVLLYQSLVDIHTLPSSMPGGSGSIIFVWILLHIFLVPDDHFVHRICGATHLLKKSSYTKRLAGEKMQAIISSITGASDTSVLQSVGYIIGSLARTVAGAENNAYRIHAAMIMQHLCLYYTKDDENLKELKKAMANVMEEVLREIVHWLTTEEIQAVTEATNSGKVRLAEGPDLEQGAVLHDNDNGQESSSTSPRQQKGEQQHQVIQLQEALVALCKRIIYSWIPEDQALTHQFNDIAAKICSVQGMPDKTLESLVQEAEDKLGERKRRRRGHQD